MRERRGGVVRYRKERKERPVVNECEDDEEGARARNEKQEQVKSRDHDDKSTYQRQRDTEKWLLELSPCASPKVEIVGGRCRKSGAELSQMGFN